MKKITGKTKAWLNSYADPDDLNGPSSKAIRAVTFSENDMTPYGWAFVGNATVSVEVPEMDVLIQNKVAALRGELQSVRAKAEIETGNIEANIQKLLAITNEVTA